MGKVKDLTGQRFDKLTVIKDSGQRKNRQVVWECQCDCGNITYVVGGALRSGHTTSCGCARKGKNIKDISNQRFGKLVVLELDYVDHNRHARWKCQCDCGNIVSILGNELRSGMVTQCHDCAKKELVFNIPSYTKINEHKFGNLTPLYPTNKRNNAGRVYWQCRCDCGTELLVPSSSLLSGNTTSCGCKRHVSQGEEKIKQLLLDNNIDFIRECTFDDLKSPRGGVLRFDFALVDNDQIIKLIEFDGIQHFEEIEYWGGADALAYLQECDSIKNQYAQQHNIPLLRIPYDQINNLTLEDII